jgi:zinc protease
MKENPRFNGIVQLKNPGRRRTMSWLIKKYKERFAMETLSFLGNIDDKVMEAFASKYIASLPTTDRKDVVSDLGYRMLKGNLKKVINKGADPKSMVSIMYYGGCLF